MFQLSQVEQIKQRLEGHTSSQVLPLAEVELMQNSPCLVPFRGIAAGE